MKFIKTSKGEKVIIDDEDFERVSQYKWWINELGYVLTTTSEREGQVGKNIRLHRFLMNFPNRKGIDHINHNPLDNRKSNLRLCTQQQNIFNARPRGRFKGVSWHSTMKKWRSRIMVNKKEIRLGYYNNIEEAALIYNKAAKKYFGMFAYLNQIGGNN